MVTNERASRPACHEISEIFKFWWVLHLAAATTGPGNTSLRASAPSTENMVVSLFFRLLWSWWMIGRHDRPVPGVWRPMVLRGTWRASTLVQCRSDNKLDNGGWKDDAPSVSSPSSSIWLSCAVKASDRTNQDTTPFHNISPSVTSFQSSQVENEVEPALQLFANYAYGRTRTNDAVL